MKFIFVTDIHLSSITPSSRLDEFTDTVFNKIEEVFNICLQEKATLLLGGDLFNTPNQPDWIKNRLKALILKYGVHVVSIIGNHDIMYYNEEYIDKSSFQSLVAPGLIEYLGYGSQESVKVNDWTIRVHGFGKEFPVITDPKTIVLSHCFYNTGHGDKLYVSKEEIQKSKAKIVCFGHDHNQYPIMNNEGTLILRPGALTRGTSHTENKVREISYAFIDTDTGDVGYRPLPNVKKFEEIFREKYDVKKVRETVSFEEIQQFIDDLSKAKLEVNPYDILLGMEKPEQVKQASMYYLSAVGLINEQ